MGRDLPSIVSWDTETPRILPGRQSPPIVCLTTATSPDPRTARLIVGRRKALEWFLEAAARALTGETRLTAHNVAFDTCAGMATAYLISTELGDRVYTATVDLLEAGAVTCSFVREKLRKVALGRARWDPDQDWKAKPSYSLANVFRQYTGIDRSADKVGPDIWRLRYGELDGIPVEFWPAKAKSYPLNDAVDAWRVHDLQGPPEDMADEHDPRRWPDEAAQVRGAWALYLTKAWGLMVDQRRVDALALHLFDKVEAAKAWLRPHGIYRANGTQDVTRTKALVAEAFEARGEEPPYTETGLVSYSEDALRRSLDPRLVALADVMSDRSELSTQIPLLRRGKVGPLSTRYDPLKVTGRSGSSGPNLQNLAKRRGIRQCIVTRDGSWFGAVDYGAAELVMFGQVLLDTVGWSELAEVLKSGRDVHSETGSAILRQSDPLATYEMVRQGYLNGDEGMTKTRAGGKAGNFGIGGALGPERFQNFARTDYGLVMTLQQSEDVINAVKARYPEIPEYFDVVGKAVRDGGGSCIITYPVSGRIYDCEGFTNASNAPFQGGVADGAKLALYRVQRECREQWGAVPCPTCQGGHFGVIVCGVCGGKGRVIDPLYGSRPVWFVHDEIGIETRRGMTPAGHTAAIDRLARVMEKALREYVPDLQEAVKTEGSAMWEWHKAAKADRDESGILSPWRPTGWTPIGG